MISETHRKISGIPLWIIPSFLLFIFTIVTRFNGLYGQDSFEYLRYSRALHEYFKEGILPGQFLWPVLYPLAGSLFSFLLPDILCLQLINIACYGFAFYFLKKILIHLFPENEKEIYIYLLLFYCLSPFVLRYSMTVMSEPMTLLFITAFYYYWLAFIKSKKHKYFPALVFFVCAAINTRYPSFVIVSIPMLHALYLFMRNFKLSFFLSSLLIIGIVFYPAFRLNVYEPGSIFGRLDFEHWSFGNYFRRSFLTSDGSHSYTFPNICYVVSDLVHPGYIFLGLVFLFFFRKNTMEKIFMKIVLVVILVYSLFLAGLPFQNDRVLLLSFPLVLILFSGPFLILTEKIIKVIHPHLRSEYLTSIFQFFGQHLKKLVIISLILIQLSLFCRAFSPFYRNNKTTQTIAMKMLEYPGKKLYIFNIDMALKGYGVNNVTVNLWSNKIDFFEPNALVLFNFAGSEKQWKGMNPMLNWESLTRDHHLKLIENFPEGWNLYEITD